MLEKSTQSIVDGEKDKHIDHREHKPELTLESRVAKAIWTRGESRRDGR